MMCNLKCKIVDVRKRASRQRSRYARQTSDIINSTSRISHSSGLTLIELLISIAIIATLATMFLGASRAAMESSRAARTKTTILKLHTLLMEQWASYETRRVDLDALVLQALDPINTPAFKDSKSRNNAMADMRLLALREVMKFEMPDRWSDVDLGMNYVSTRSGTRSQAAVFLESIPTVTRTYYRRYTSAINALTKDLSAVEARKRVNDNQGAECLYLTVMLLTGDGEARTMFSPQDIGDVDEDGLPEFLDGWGNPIEFLRWAPGFVAKSSLMTGDSWADHDPFDPFLRNSLNAIGPNPGLYGTFRPYIEALRGSLIPTSMSTGGQVGFRLVPLIYSGGPDGEKDLITAREVIMSANSGSDAGLLNPYFPNDENNNYAMGSPHGPPYVDDDEDGYTDNITNHLQEGR